MKTVLLLLFTLIFIPHSFAQENSAKVASIDPSVNYEQRNVKSRNYFQLDSYDLLDLDVVYENTYDFVKAQYSYYKELEIFERELPNIETFQDSVSFVGGVLPFFSLAENEGQEGSSISNDGLSVFFYYKKQF